MPGTIEFPLLPEEAVTLGPRLAVIETPKELVFMNASGPLMSCSRNDVTAKRYIGAVLMVQGLTKGEDLAPVLGVHRSTLFRNQKLYREGGLDAIRDERGHGAPRRAHKLTDEVLPIAQARLDQGGSQSAAAREVGVSETAIRHLISKMFQPTHFPGSIAGSPSSESGKSANLGSPIPTSAPGWPRSPTLAEVPC